MFSEYFHGDNGAGLGAAHQTGWTGVVADLIRRRHGAVSVHRRRPPGGAPAGKPAAMTRATCSGAVRPGIWFPLGATLPRRRHELRGRVRDGRRDAAVPVRQRRCGDPDPDAGSRRLASGTRSCRASAPGRRTATGRPVRTTRAAGPAATRPSCCSTPTPWRSAGRSGSGPRCSATCPTTPTRPSTLDSAAHVPRSLVVDPAYDWTTEPAAPRRYADTVIYEVHVKGFTAAHPEVPAELRGTYAGLGHEAAIAHLLDLGVTAVELLPVHQSVPEAFLAGRGPDQLLGLQHHRLLRAARRLLRRGPGRAPGRPGRRVQGHGRRAARRRARGAARRGVQPHRRGRPRAARRCATAGWTTRPTTDSTRTTRAATSTRPAAGTPSTPATRSPCS